MNEYKLSKTLGIVLGIIMVIASFGYGFLYFLGRSLGNVLISTTDTTANDIAALGIILSICVIGLITFTGCFGLRGTRWRRVYIRLCLIVGVALLVMYFISIGSLGTMYEFSILLMSIFYLLLGYFVKKEI
ncbi:hypothetical protein KGF86_06245 [Ornithinibacillus massiliensis]|uniref:DUF4064 domain-containing protein n=1 Tax=Ornithinibacillus massiliensis TaxID=1944633 RepID=A0ABS5MBW0_9BACI|nr:hypothetical protein [Ornithinibacillus massiliensis]MBS3679810.1 hypothetical protein [Ornithinibacillus massiliensis]